MYPVASAIPMIHGALIAAWQGGQGLGVALLPMVFILGIAYFLLIVPQQRRQKRWQEMVNSLKSGDRVATGGGIRGTIISVKDDSVQLRVPPDNLRLEVTKASVVSVYRDEETQK